MKHSRILISLLLVFSLMFVMTSCGDNKKEEPPSKEKSEVQNELEVVDTEKAPLSYFFSDESQYCAYKYSAPKDAESVDIIYECYEDGNLTEQTKLLPVDFSKRENGRTGTVSVFKSGNNEYALMWASEDMKSKEECYDVVFSEKENRKCISYNAFSEKELKVGVKYPIFLSIFSEEDGGDSLQPGQVTCDELISQPGRVNVIYLIFN